MTPPLTSGADEDLAVEEVTSLEDERFDLIYPPPIRKLSPRFWTPVRIAAEAAKLLVASPATRVLDVGCGPGKFCLVGVSLTDGQFTGVEQRSDLVAAAREAGARLNLADVKFLHANIVDVSFARYDAFYIFNPFEEHLFEGHKIDSAIPRSPELFKSYTSYVAAQLAVKPLGTRVVSYAGYGDEIPACYSCEQALFRDDLKLWIKSREGEPDRKRFGLRTSRSYRARPLGVAAMVR